MTATLNGSGALNSASLPTGTDIVHRSTGETVKFVRWTGMPGECADINVDGGNGHACNVSTEYRLADPMPRPDDPQEVALASLQIEVEQATQATEQVRAELSTANARIADLIREKSEAEARVEKFWDDLGEEADRRDWCDEYDSWAVMHGGPSRDVEVDWSGTVEVRIDANSLVEGMNIDGVECVDSGVTVRFPVSGCTQGRKNRCLCDSYQVIEQATRMLDSEGAAYIGRVSVVEQGCDNCQ